MKTSYTYTILRYVHDTTTSEFANVGVILYAPGAKFAGAICRTKFARLSKMFPGLEIDPLKRLLSFIQARVEEFGSRWRGELPLESPAESAVALARAILPPDDSSLQWSEPGGGITDNPSLTLENIYTRMVEQYDEAPSRPARTDEEVWKDFRKPLEKKHILHLFQAKKISVKDDEVEFQCAWKNEKWHCLEPVSFDLIAPEGITDKAHKWLGQITSIKDAPDPFKVYLLLGEPQSVKLRPAFEKAISILKKMEVPNELVRESEAAEFADNFASAIQAHAPKGK